MSERTVVSVWALIALLADLLLAGCGGAERTGPSGGGGRQYAFADLIDHHGLPAAAEDWGPVPFADQGAWFGFTLPPAGISDEGAGFGGPFFMDGGRWVGPSLARLELTGARTIGSTGHPGSLVLETRAGDLDLEQILWFADARTALVRSRIRNEGHTACALALTWKGEVFPEEAVLEAGGRGVLATKQDGACVRILADRASHEPTIEGNRYRWEMESATIAPGDSLTMTLALTLTMAGDRDHDCAAVLSSSSTSLANNAGRWRGYITAATSGCAPGGPTEIVAVKSVQTLLNNWRGPTGRFRHGGLFPSSNVWYFNGFWAWDSWKHAVGLSSFAPDIAAGQLRLMFDHQDETGMIADVVYLDPAEDNWRDTKPPLAGWALSILFDRTGDLDLVRELYPRLTAYHQFWYTDRDHDGDGLCEYGSVDGTLEAARWESGMDNAVRFDRTKMLQNGESAWSMDQESVDLNSYLHREKLALGSLASALGQSEEAARWAAEAGALRARIQQTMYDEATGWYYDIHINSGEIVPVQGPEGWIPLWTGVATREQAARLRETMLDPAKFRTFVPFPTVARDHPDFSDGYWRGLVWLDQVYFAIDGLRANGYREDADELTRQVLANLEGAAIPGVPLRENYHPLTGEGRNVKHFSWTAAHLLMLVRARQAGETCN